MPRRYVMASTARARAEECRRLVVRMPSSEARKKKLQVAADYERMADRAANRDVSEVDKSASNPEVPKPR
jgi:hypothetical protein